MYIESFSESNVKGEGYSATEVNVLRIIALVLLVASV